MTDQQHPITPPPELVAKPAVDEADRRFEEWWYNEGSGMPPRINEDSEEHAHRVSRAAWRQSWRSRATASPPFASPTEEPPMTDHPITPSDQ